MIKIAIVGATGLVGRTMIQILHEEKVAAKYLYINSKNLTEKLIKKFKPNYALFAVSADLAKLWVPFFVSQGCKVIDNSSAYRNDREIPLVVPECNREILDDYCGNIIANPNCSTIGAVVALKPLDDAYRIKRIVYSTYQAISGAGANPVFPYPIENNLIPYISGEEEKMVLETKKILGRENIAISATCVRVPVANCHTISIYAEFEVPMNLDEVNEILRTSSGMVLLSANSLEWVSEDRLDRVDYPMPIVANGRNEVFVGRVRLADEKANALNLITVSDNIRKGAAYNAVQILKILIANDK